jgi:hypothetical protein
MCVFGGFDDGQIRRHLQHKCSMDACNALVKWPEIWRFTSTHDATCQSTTSFRVKAFEYEQSLCVQCA